MLDMLVVQNMNHSNGAWKPKSSPTSWRGVLILKKRPGPRDACDTYCAKCPGILGLVTRQKLQDLARKAPAVAEDTSTA